MTAAQDDPISTHDVMRLTDYFDAHIKKPWVFVVLPANIENIGANVELTTIGKIFNATGIAWLLKTFLKRPRLSYATWLWLRPAEPIMSLDDIDSIRQQSSLGYMSKQEFVSRLCESCQDIARKNNRFSLWVTVRIALLEYVQQCELLPDTNTYKAAPELKHLLIQSVVFLGKSAPDLAIKRAKETSATALQAAAQVVREVFCDEQCAVSANLMVPVNYASLKKSTITRNDDTKANFKLAKETWSEASDFKDCLLIVSETSGSGHLGFWVPDIHNRDGILPGAPYAFSSMNGDAVFTDDLSRPQGLNKSSADKWIAYMEDQFKDQLFISLPLIVTKLSEGGGGSVVAAVLNVNARPANMDTWRRAYHQEWLKRAILKAGEFVEVALFAYLVEKTAGNTADYPALSIGCPMWNTLPGLDEIPTQEEQ